MLGGILKRPFVAKLLFCELRDAVSKHFFLWLKNSKVKELIKEELKKGKEKPESRRESKHEERKRGKKEKEDSRKGGKIAASDVSRSPAGKKSKEKEKAESAKTKENRKKSTPTKDLSSKMALRDTDDRKEGRSSTRLTTLAKGNSHKRKN